jgi:outer membrane receptor for ferrienterochelin and colicins
MNLRAKLRLLCAVTLTAGAFALPASAEEEIIQLDTVVVTAAGFEQKIVDAPASISVITREELEKKPYLTLLDAVRDVEGIDIGETVDKTGQGTISIRGMGSDYTLIMIDGKRQNNVGDIYPNSFGGNQFNHIPPLDMIERVEVVRGPMSTLYGADAMGGVINIITKKIADRWTGSASFSRTFQEDSKFGEDSTSSFNIMGPVFQGKLGFSLHGSLFEREASEPSMDSVVAPDGTIVERSLGFGGWGKTAENKTWNLGARLTYTPNKSNTITLDYDTSNQKYDNGESNLGTLDSINTIWTNQRVGYHDEMEFTRDQWSLTHNGDFGNVKTEVRLTYVDTANEGRTLPLSSGERLFVQDMKSKYGSAYNDFLANATPAEIAQFQALYPRPDRTLESRSYTIDAKSEIALGNHYLVIGGQFIDAEMEDGVFGLKDGTFKDGTVQDHRQWSLFAEDSWKALQFLTITGGLRYDHHNEFDGNFSPRLYAVVDLNDSWTLKGGVSTGYKAPKASDLYAGITGFGGQGTSPWIGNPDLKPEKSVNGELAIYYEHKNGHNFNATIASGEATNVDFGDGWDQIGSGYDSYRMKKNLDEADIQGLELAGKLKLPYGFALRANYTYTDSEITKGEEKGKPLTDTAEHMANATLDWYATPKLTLFLNANYSSERTGGEYTLGSGATAVTSEYKYKAFTLLHLGASYKLTENLTINGRVNNLLDEDFSKYKVRFLDANNDGDYNDSNEIAYINDYNTIHKARSYWVSVTASF